jgi:dTDP-4-dehydrorhamnose 3,5-epimerase
MIFTPLSLTGAWIIDIERLEDDRGFFARTYCQKQFAEHGLNPNIAQCNISYNKVKGTLRGMHLQVEPFQEVKLVQCIQGSIFDVMIDLRPNSPTFCEYVGVELSAENHKMLYIPEGFAHGFITLEDHSTIFYQMSQFYAPSYARGFRWNDPRFGINWPIDVKVISDRDRSYPDFS